MSIIIVKMLHNFDFASFYSVTDVTIPPICGERILLPVIQTVLSNGGKILEAPSFGTDGSIFVSPITFQSNEAQERCCKEIEEIIKTVIEIQNPISIKPVEGNEKVFEVKFSLKFFFMQFHELMKTISPAIEFIENNGGWFNSETGNFPGFDALESSRVNGTLNKEQSDALLTLSNFMAIYTVGNHLIEEKYVTVVPPKE